MTTPEIRQRITEIVSKGLIAGLGKPEAGQFCIEAAICLAYGEPHGDQPSCVAWPDRNFAMRLNDAEWSTPMARAEAMLPLGLAQLGTAGADRTEWVRRVQAGTIRRIVPIALRNAAAVHPDASHKAVLEAAAVRCENEGTKEAAAAADRATAAAAYATNAATATALDDAATAAALGDAANAAANAAYYARFAARTSKDPDSVLRLAVEIALDAYEKTK